jgi:hypothetical protein
MLDLVANILKVANALLDIVRGVSALSQDRRNRLADLLLAIRETLSDASAQLRRGETPHGACGALRLYSEDLESALAGIVPDQRASDLRDTLMSSYAIEMLAVRLSEPKEKTANLAVLDEAAGKFEAAAKLLRAG